MPISIDGLRGHDRAARWRGFGLRSNPFPPSGVETDVEYDRPEVTSTINRWLEESLAEETRSFAPLVIYGDVGVGKTHLLHRMAAVVTEYSGDARVRGEPGWSVQRVALPDFGQGRLELSNLMLATIRGSEGGIYASSLPLPILGLVQERLFASPHPADLLERAIPGGSDLLPPLRRLVSTRNSDDRTRILDVLGRWLLRNTPSPAQRSVAALPGAISGEGQATAAYCDLLQLLRELGVSRGAVFLLDQVEDLWRRKAITDSRRARFLTDVRGLIDHALAGAPVVTVLAWNTNPPEGHQTTSSLFESNYVALWTRLSQRLEIKPLRVAEVVPFAREYVVFEERATTAATGVAARRSLLDSLTTAVVAEVVERAQKRQFVGKGLVIQRPLVAELRVWADSVVRPE